MPSIQRFIEEITKRLRYHKYGMMISVLRHQRLNREEEEEKQYEVSY